jgi:rubrerythrin
VADSLVTIQTFRTAHEAELAKARLETGGVQAFLADAEMIRMDWAVGNAIGWIKLQVADDDAALAAEILGEIQQTRVANKLIDNDGEKGVCPACGVSMAESLEACPACGWTFAKSEKN